VAAARLLSLLFRHGGRVGEGRPGSPSDREASRNGRPAADRNRGRWWSGFPVSSDRAGLGIWCRDRDR
jgi:hypothetical protein